MLDTLTRASEGKTGADALKAMTVARRYAKEKPGLSAATFRSPLVQNAEWMEAATPRCGGESLHALGGPVGGARHINLWKGKRNRPRPGFAVQSNAPQRPDPSSKRGSATRPNEQLCSDSWRETRECRVELNRRCWKTRSNLAALQIGHD